MRFGFALLALAACSGPAAKPKPPEAPEVKRTAVPEIVVDEVVQPKELAVDATHVYFVGGSTVWRAEKRTEAKPTQLALGTRPVGIALDVAYVWWGDLDGVYRVPKAGGKTERVTSGRTLGAFARSPTRPLPRRAGTSTPNA